MDAITLLKEQHDEVSELFAQCEDLDGDELVTLFQEIADMLAVHASIEEKIFYPAVKDVDPELILEALEEHLAVKRVIADLLAMPDGDDTYKAKVKVLKEEVEHHVEEEQDDLFPEVKKALGKARLDDLGAQMEAMVEELEGDDPRLNIPSEIGQAPTV